MDAKQLPAGKELDARRIAHPMLDASNQGACDMEVYRNGEGVAIIAGGSAKLIERLICEVREASGQRVDWNYVGGRAVVKAVGDIELVREALRRFMLQIQFPEML